MRHFPAIGDRLYLLQKEIVVMKILKGFSLVQIRYLEDSIGFFIDICALTEKPDFTNSVSLQILRRCGS